MMTIKIDKDLCHGCPGRKEGLCERICPGNLLSREDGKAKIDRPEDCWDCAACVKACPVNAIQIYLPEEIGGKGGKLAAQLKKDEIVWVMQDIEEQEKKYKVNR
ncbi:MAG: indolepyruvate ferredoxin oxidoreductase subunit alpha [Bacillota bacterium]